MSLDSQDPLAGPKLKIERAKCHIQELESILDAFCETPPYRQIVEIDSVNGKKIIKLRATKKPPVEGAVVIGEILYLLKSALDHTVTAVAKKRGCRIHGTGFPVEPTREKFERSTLYRQIKQRLPELAQIISDLKPYKSGDDLLWWLHKLNGIEKHQAVMQVVSAMVGAELEFVQTAGARRVEVPNTWQPISEDEDAILFIVSIDTALKANVGIYSQVIFKEIDSATPHAIIDTTQQFIDLTAGIVNIIENKFFA